ncbi:MAG TPA: hypothetical protein VFP98_00470, partial [Candidatus Polarisedimenticolia bacterium]|nr:hypothetical protein [Candidatus Polarisedimenticolia bacterium]
MPEPAASLLDTRRFKIAVTAVLGLVACSTCVILGHRAVSYQRGVWGAALYASGEPVRAYPYLVNAAAAPLLGRLNAGPWLDLGEVAAWAIEDPRFRRFHPEVTPELAVRLAFVSHAEALLRRPTSSTAMAGLADLFRRVRTLRVKASTPSLADLAAPEGGGTRSPEDALVEAAYRKAIEMEP